LAALLLILFVIAIAISFGANFVPQLHLRVAASVFLQSLTMLISTAALLAFYFSARCRMENFDLHFLGESLRADAGPADGEITSRI
jgi:hypothetical protein